MDKMTDQEIEEFQKWFPLTRERADAGFIPVLQAHWIEWFIAIDHRSEGVYETTRGFNNNTKTRDFPEEIYLARNGKWFVRRRNEFRWIKSGWAATTQVRYELEDVEGVSDVQ